MHSSGTGQENLLHSAAAMFRRAKAFVLRDLLIAFSYRLKFFAQIGSILISTMLFYCVGLMIGQGGSPALQPYGNDYFAFALIGIAFADYLFVSINSFADEIRRGQMLGTFEALLITPLSAGSILVYASLYNFGATTLRIALYLCFGALFFGVHLQFADPLAFLLVVLLTIAAFWGIGLFSAAFVILFKQTSPLNWVMGPLSGLAGGIIYPVSVLPWWLKWLAALLPITHSLEALRRLLLNGAGLADVQGPVTVLACFAAILMAGGLFVFNRAMHLARRQGSLLHY